MKLVIHFMSYVKVKINITFSQLIKIYVLGQANCCSQSNGLYIQMAILKCGDFFGGKGLFNNASIIATVEAEDEVLCLVISRKLFDRELRLIINQLREAEHLYGLFKNQF
jgi:CRP-like cAMP-binding protein